MKKTKVLMSVMYISLFALIFYIMKCSPIMCDDYTFLFHSEGTIKSALYESLHYGNGRFLGNFITAFLVHYQLPLHIINAGILTLLIVLIPKITSNSDDNKILLYTITSAVIILGVCPLIFSEVFAWESGFNNYVPPVLLAVVCFLLVQREENSKFKKIISYSLIIIFGISAQLFVELNTVVIICFIAFLILYYFITDKKKLPKTCTWFVSSIIGGAIMFIIPKVFEPSGIVDVANYRKLHIGSVSDLLQTAFKNAYDAMYYFSKNEVLFLILSVLLLIILKKEKESWKSKILFSVCKTGIIVASALFIFNGIISRYLVYTKYATTNDMLMYISTFVVVAVLIAVALHLSERKTKIRLIVCVAFAVFSVCPMMLVSPFSSRCLLICYIFLSIAAVLLLNYLAKDLSYDSIKKISKSGALILCGLACFLIVVFSDINWMCTQQTKYTELKLKEKPSEIEIMTMDNDYIHFNMTWEYACNYYNEKPNDIKYNEISFAEWYAHRQAEGWYK